MRHAVGAVGGHAAYEAHEGHFGPDVDLVLGINEIGYRISQSTINDTTPYAAVLSAFLVSCLYGDVYALRSTFNMPPSRGPVLSENVIANSGMYKDFIADVSFLHYILGFGRVFNDTVDIF